MSAPVQIQDGPIVLCTVVRKEDQGDPDAQTLCLPVPLEAAGDLPKHVRALLAAGDWVADRANGHAIEPYKAIGDDLAQYLTPGYLLVRLSLAPYGWAYRFPGSAWRGPYQDRQEAQEATEHRTRSAMRGR